MEHQQPTWLSPNFCLFKRCLSSRTQRELVVAAQRAASNLRAAGQPAPLCLETEKSHVTPLFAKHLGSKTCGPFAALAAGCRGVADRVPFPTAGFRYIPEFIDCFQYAAGNGRLGGHVDRVRGWVLVLSLGCACDFWVKEPGDDARRVVTLSSGDAVVFDGGPSASVVHGITAVSSGSCPSYLGDLLGERRMSLQFRCRWQRPSTSHLISRRTCRTAGEERAAAFSRSVAGNSADVETAGDDVDDHGMKEEGLEGGAGKGRCSRPRTIRERSAVLFQQLAHDGRARRERRLLQRRPGGGDGGGGHPVEEEESLSQ